MLAKLNPTNLQGHALPLHKAHKALPYISMPFHIYQCPFIYIDALPCPSKPQYDMAKHRRAFPTKHNYKKLCLEGHALLCFAISYWGLEGHGRASIYGRAL